MAVKFDKGSLARARFCCACCSVTPGGWPLIFVDEQEAREHKLKNPTHFIIKEGAEFAVIEDKGKDFFDELERSSSGS